VSRTDVTCPVFVGRVDELSALARARVDLGKSHGSTLLIDGDAGIGKSRLLAQFRLATPATRERTFVSGECLPWAQAPFGPIRSFARDLSSKFDFAGAPPRAVQALAQESLGLEKADIFAGFVELFAFAAQRRAIVYLLEDLHWSDRATLEFLTYWAPRLGATRQLLVATFRSDHLEERGPLFDAVSQLSRLASVRRIALGALSPAHVRELVDAVLAGRQLDSGRRAEIERRCEGNPFFAEELLKASLEDGLPSERALPISVRASVLQRLEALDNDARRALEYAAVLGDRIDPSLLTVMLERTVDDVLPTLRSARELGILVDDERERGSVRFRHALTRQAIYDEIPAFDARPLHERAVAALEAVFETTPRLEALAYHAWAAGDAARTQRYGELAGNEAVALCAFAEAAAHFDRALDAALTDEDRARLFERLGHAAEQLGDLRRSVAAFEHAFDLRRGRGEFDDAARVLTWLAADRSNLGDGEAAREVQAFVDRHREHVSVTMRDRLLALAARLTSATYDFAATRRILEKIERVEALEPVARQNTLIAVLNECAALGDVAPWRIAAAEMFEVAPALRQFLASIALYTVAQTGAALAAHDEVERALTAADTIARARDFTAIAAFGAVVRARYLFLRGRLDDARSALLDALERGSDVFVTRYLAATVGVSIALALDEPSLAERTLRDDVIRAAREGTIVAEDALVLAELARWLAARGSLDSARVELRLALETPHLGQPQVAPVLLAAAEFLETTELSPVCAVLDAAATAACPAQAAMAALIRSVLASRNVRGAGSTVSHAGEAARRFREVGWPLYEARALLLAGNDREAARLRARCAGAAAAPPAISAGALAGLSRREWNIAKLIGDGLTNAAIAQHLGVSPKTVEKQLSNLFAKCRVHSRAQVAALVARGLPDPPSGSVSYDEANALVRERN